MQSINIYYPIFVMIFMLMFSICILNIQLKRNRKNTKIIMPRCYGCGNQYKQPLTLIQDDQAKFPCQNKDCQWSLLVDGTQTN